MMKKKTYLIIFSCIFLFSSVYSQSDSTKTYKKVPTLNEHTFASFSHFRPSFITTNLRANMGFGSTSVLKIPGFEINDQELFTFEGKLLFFNLNVRYQQRFRPWLALYFSFTTSGRIGTDISTILIDGVNTLSGGNIGWLIRIREWEKFNLSATVNVNNFKGNFINVKEYLEDLIDGEPNPRVIHSIPATNVGIGLYGAYAVNPSIGLQFQSEFFYGESFVRGLTKGFYNVGVIADFDLNPKYGVPINLGVGYNLSSEPSVVMEGGGVSNMFIGKLGYSGAQDYELGLQFSYYDIYFSFYEGNPYVARVALLLNFYF